MPPAAPDSASDTRLVESARGGSADAFGQLVSRHQDRVYNVCYRMCHNHADALDLTQATFLRAYDRLSDFEHRSAFLTWLYRIAVNLTVSHARRTRSRGAALDSGALRLVSSARQADDSPDARLQREETRAALDRALDALDPDFRAAVVLRDVEGLDYAEIAAALGVALGTVKSRICRARQMLREALLREDARREG